MARTSLVAILALLLGAATTACTNETDDSSGRGGGGTVSSRKREPNTASGEISGEAETPDPSAPSGEGDDTNTSDDGAEGETTPPPSSDPGTTPTPPPDPDPADPDPIPTGSFAAGTELVTTANLNIRDGADTSYPIITTVPKGSRVMVATVSGAGGWVNVSYQGNVGWSSKSYLTVP